MADELPPVDGMEYPEKPTGDDVSEYEMMQWMERVDRYWQKRGSQKIDFEEARSKNGVE